MRPWQTKPLQAHPERKDDDDVSSWKFFPMKNKSTTGKNTAWLEGFKQKTSNTMFRRGECLLRPSVGCFEVALVEWRSQCSKALSNSSGAIASMTKKQRKITSKTKKGETSNNQPLFILLHFPPDSLSSLFESVAKREVSKTVAKLQLDTLTHTAAKAK